MWACKVNESDK